jgi:coproporphyrinogen dehydrogenase
MDHFALPTDSMYKAFQAHQLHRNFMGYTASKTQLMIGLGMSAISDSWYAFAQNEKELEAYYARLEKNEIPVCKGHILNNEDLIIRRHILNLMCQFTTSWESTAMQFEGLNEVLARLAELQNDGLLHIGNHSITVPDEGKPFIRNICMAFDLRLQRKMPNTKIFSMTV